MTQNNTQLTTTNGTTAFSMTWDQVWDAAAARHDDSHQPVPAQQAWRDAVAIITLRAKDHYGSELHGRLDKAQYLVLSGHVTLSDGVATVSSETDSATRYDVNGACDCPDAERKAKSGMCKHRLAVLIHKRAYQKATALVKLRSATARPAASEPSARIPPQFITRLHGKDFVQFCGLLAMAHAQDLNSLDAHFLSVDGELATAIATATFADGRTFTECGDASPSNVNATIRPHFARMALTRAKARALRDALNIGMCSIEELGDDGDGVRH